MPKKKNKTASETSLFIATVSGVVIALPLDCVEGVAPLTERIAIPGNRSRVLTYLAYQMGQLISLVDVLPLFNKRSSDNAAQVLIIRWEGEYYGIAVDTVQGITHKAKQAVRSAIDIVTGATAYQKQTAFIIDVGRLITHYVCN